MHDHAHVISEGKHGHTHSVEELENVLGHKHNVKAIKCYAVYGFNVVGECYMYDQDFLCYEKELECIGCLDDTLPL